MTDQNTISNREQWLADLKKSRLEYRPVGRKLTLRGSYGGATTKYHQSNISKPAEPIKVFASTKPNPFPFNRQHKSRVLYRSLNKSSTSPLVNSKTLKHSSLK